MHAAPVTTPTDESTSDLSSLADDLITAGGRADTAFGLYVVPGTRPAAELGRAVERDVFLEYFGNTAEMLAHEYDPYEASSVFLCVMDHRRRIAVGAMRLILPSPAGLKTIDDLERVWGDPAHAVMSRTDLDMPARQVWDIATLAVARDYRGAATDGLISLALYQAVIQLARQRGVRWVLAVLDLVVLDLIQGGTGRPFSRFAGIEPASYLDSPSSLPVWCDLPEYGERLALTDPGMHEILFEGRGLQEAVSIPQWHLDVPDESELAAVG